jgi:hypothetical protein
MVVAGVGCQSHCSVAPVVRVFCRPISASY